jgi:16S rRNA (cytidine1402-2'-O)-methyltransferase
VARELTKLYETCIRGPLDVLAADPRFEAPKGEIVILVGPGEDEVATAADAETALREAMTRLPLGEAASEVAKALGLSRKDLYRQALAMKEAG